MKSVVDNGTGGSLRWKYKFYSPAAGKTGTTNNKTDALLEYGLEWMILK